MFTMIEKNIIIGLLILGYPAVFMWVCSKIRPPGW
jgi:hypothetical protein